MEWQINTAEYLVASGDRSNVITTVHWRVTKTVGEHSAGSYGSAGLEAPGDTFIAWADVTEANVLAWVQAALGEEMIASMEASLDAQIAEQATPTTGSGVPWSA
jgi:hypothetical protein